MSKILGVEQWAVLLVGTVPPGANGEAMRAAIAQGISTSAAIAPLMTHLSITIDRTVVNALTRCVEPVPGPKLV